MANLFELLNNGMDFAWKAFIRPVRMKYSERDLGPEFFEVQDTPVRRKDFTVLNNRRQELKCSLYYPTEATSFPCVVYLHGNSGNRLEAKPLINELLPRKIALCSLDFAGSGISDGQFISLGWQEAKDLKLVVRKLRKRKKIKEIALWGRSMGAVTALLYTGRYDRKISGMVLDSPFSSLRRLALEHIAEKSGMPDFMNSSVYSYIQAKVKENAHFDMCRVEPVDYLTSSVPAVFITGLKDGVVGKHHVVRLFNKFRGAKCLAKLRSAGHNSSRPPELQADIMRFLAHTFGRRKFVGFKMISISTFPTVKKGSVEAAPKATCLVRRYKR